MKLSIIVATDEEGLIGKDNDLPWKLSADLQYFRRVTMGKALIMGRRTHESIGRALPGRKNIVITSDQEYESDGCTISFSVQQALQECENIEEVMVVGGASLYKQFLPEASTIYLTLVHATLSGDTWFPDWDKNQWQVLSEEKFSADEKNEHPYSFIVYKRN
jgi:dihydrofolate reductase